MEPTKIYKLVPNSRWRHVASNTVVIMDPNQEGVGEGEVFLIIESTDNPRGAENWAAGYRYERDADFIQECYEYLGMQGGITEADVATICKGLEGQKISEKNLQTETASQNPFEKQPFKYDKIRRRVHYTDLELAARSFELRGEFFGAKNAFENARIRMAVDLEIDAEEKALDTGNILAKKEYVLMTAGEKAAWDLKGLREFKHYHHILNTYYWY